MFNGNGTDSVGFRALPSGTFSGGAFGSAGYGGFWWSATESSAAKASYRVMGYNNANVTRYNLNKTDGFSARCLED